MLSMLLVSLLSPAAPVAPTPHTVIGVVTEQGRPVCEGGHTPRWTDLRLEVGFVPVTGADARLRPWLNRPVWVRGQASAEQRVLRPQPPCELVQWRGDWLAGPHGVRSVAEGDTRPAAFAVADAGLVDVTATRAGDQITVRLTNPLAVPLRDARLTVHYEGCYGKPGSSTQAGPTATLAAGAAVTFAAPALLERPADRRRRYRATRVSLAGQAEGVLVDLDLPLAQLGITTACPEGGGR